MSDITAASANLGRVEKWLQFSKKHWKKAVIATPFVSFFAYFMHGRYEEDRLVRLACQRAQVFGRQKLKKATDKVEKVIVFVNPAANNQKSVNQLERSLLPMLHLAGLDVRVVKTEEEGEAKELVAAADDTDAIVVAGGDGTVSEIITGILRSGPKIQKQPLLIAPCGYRHNSLFGSINHKIFKRNSTIQNLISSGDLFLHKITKPVSVMQIEPRIGKGWESSRSNNYSTIYSCVGLSMGPARDALDEKQLSKFWYLGPLKKVFFAAKKTFSLADNQAQVLIKWTEPCKGCSTCRAAEIDAEKRKLAQSRKSFWGSSSINKQLLRSSAEVLKFEKMENRKCSDVKSRVVSADHIMVTPNVDCLNVSIVSNSTRWSYFTNCLKRFRDRTSGFSHADCGTLTRISCKEVWMEPSSEHGLPEWFSVDNENFEGVPFRAKFLQNELKVFVQ